MNEQPANLDRPRLASMGLAIASLVLGILAVLLSLFLIGGLLGLVGLGLGLTYLCRKTPPRGMASWGVALSLIGVLLSGGAGYYLYHFIKQYREMMESAGGLESNFDRWKGVLVPDLTVTTLDGATIRLSELRGKRVVLDFWATWCPPCRMEIPHFVQLAGETSRDEIIIVGISDEAVETIKAFAEKNGVNYALGTSADLPAPFNAVHSIPTTFFIDRKGVIQDVLIGYHDFEVLKREATAADSEGEPLAAPGPVAGGLRDSAQPVNAVLAWQASFPGVVAMCAGNWDDDPAMEILVADAGSGLNVLGGDGKLRSFLKMPRSFPIMEVGRHREQGPRLLGYANWGKEVMVMNTNGDEVWSYGSPWGVDGAHWGDLDGDGSDEMVVGMNGAGGLQAVSADGKQIWRFGRIGNVWNQAVIPARDGQPAMILATEASGAIYVLDASGNLLRTFRANGRYSSSLAAGAVDTFHTVQVVTVADRDQDVCAMTGTGELVWTTPYLAAHKSWRSANFALGDVKADGTNDWAFVDSSGDLVLVSPSGEKLGSIRDGKAFDEFVFASAPSARDLLVTRTGNTISAYRFE